jgi:single-strand DNA-binding protein
MVNRVILVGNLTRDAERIDGARGPVTKMRLLTTTQWRDAEGKRQETAEHHHLVCFGRLADICAAYCTSSRRIYVEGRLRTREYDDANGVRHAMTEVVINTMRLLDSRDSNGGYELIPPGASMPEIPAGNGCPVGVATTQTGVSVTP